MNMKFCRHDWYVFEEKTGPHIREEVERGKITEEDIHLYYQNRGSTVYEEKICLKCGKYINGIKKYREEYTLYHKAEMNHLEYRKQKAIRLRDEYEKNQTR